MSISSCSESPNYLLSYLTSTDFVLDPLISDTLSFIVNTFEYAMTFFTKKHIYILVQLILKKSY